MGAPLAILAPAITTRAATPGDARLLARLADMAGEGLPSHIWAAEAGPGRTALDMGIARARRDRGAFSWRNARVACWHGAAVGTIVDYDLDGIEDGPAPALVAPLLELEARATGTRYVNILAVLPEARRRRVARSLVTDAARRTDRDLSLIVASGNRSARGFYVAHGFDEVARHAMAPGGPEGLAGDWILMRRAAR